MTEWLTRVDSVIALSAIASVHLFAGSLLAERAWKRQFISLAGGVSVAYVFAHLLPELGLGQVHFSHDLHSILPFLENHVYLMSLFGLLLFYGVDYFQPKQTAGEKLSPELTFWVHLAAIACLNLSVGYAIGDNNNPDAHPLAWFAIAMSLHYFIVDHALREVNEHAYQRVGKWILVVSLFSGAALGVVFEVSRAAVSLLIAFVAGVTIMNVMRSELPERNARSKHNFIWFVLGCVGYAGLLVLIV